LAVGPPGEAARSINPTASSGASPKPFARKKQIKGKMSIWQARPINTAFG